MSTPPLRQIRVCECDWGFHAGVPCANTLHPTHPTEAAMSRLCTPCLYVCEAEREDARRMT